MVTDSTSYTADGGKSRLSADYRYGEKFKELCPEYMSLGMSYSDFWDGDCEIAVYYRKAFVKKCERKNEELWLQGIYIYEALLDVAPVFNPVSKKHKALPYRTSPIPLTDVEKEKQKDEKNREKLNAGKTIFKAMASNVNKSLKEKGGSDNGGRT